VTEATGPAWLGSHDPATVSDTDEAGADSGDLAGPEHPESAGGDRHQTILAEPTDPATGELAEPDRGQAPVTGQPAIDAVLHSIAQVADRAPGDQIPAFQAAHRTLRETLASIDEE
jgi:hypothetical protein